MLKRNCTVLLVKLLELDERQILTNKLPFKFLKCCDGGSQVFKKEEWSNTNVVSCNFLKKAVDFTSINLYISREEGTHKARKEVRLSKKWWVRCSVIMHEIVRLFKIMN